MRFSSLFILGLIFASSVAYASDDFWDNFNKLNDQLAKSRQQQTQDQQSRGQKCESHWEYGYTYGERKLVTTCEPN